ncbi:MAG: DUF736 domain-containing protein [Hyphomicrobiaceae bacterium]
MPVIGTFTLTHDGYEGVIRTLTIDAIVQIVTNTAKTSDGAPDFRIWSGATEIGAAWRRTKSDATTTYLRITLDDPAWPQPVWAVLLEDSRGKELRLMWRRGKRGEA